MKLKCNMCGKPVRTIPTGSKLKDIHNKVVTQIGNVCMPCLIKYKMAMQEADNMTEEEREKVTRKRMTEYFKSKGMKDSEIEQAIQDTAKAVSEKENENKS